MALTEKQQREESQKSALNAERYRKQTFQQQFRGDLMQANKNTTENENAPEEQLHRNRLAILKAGAIKQANARAGAAVGASVGGTIGSIVPYLGTGIGIFLGRFIGKKAGITGIIIFILLVLLLLFIIFIALIKGYCDTLTIVGQTVDYFTTNICSSLE